MSGSGYNLSRVRVLIVDDNKNMREIIRSMLEAFGVSKFREAEEGEVGYKRFVEFNPDLVICDWNMEPVDGIEFTRRVRNNEDSPNRFVPVVMLTANTEAHHVVQARDVGVTEYLAKPLSAQSLYQRISAAIESPRPFVRTKTYFGPDRRRKRKGDYEGPERRVSDQEANAAD